MKKRLLVWLLAAVCTVNIIGCGNSASSKYDGAYEAVDYAYDEPAAMAKTSSANMGNYTEEAVAYDEADMYDMNAEAPASANTATSMNGRRRPTKKNVWDIAPIKKPSQQK